MPIKLEKESALAFCQRRQNFANMAILFFLSLLQEAEAGVLTCGLTRKATVLGGSEDKASQGASSAPRTE